MTSYLTLFDWLWIAFLFSIVITSAYLIGNDTKEVRREEREADDFQDSINEMKHKNHENNI